MKGKRISGVLLFLLLLFLLAGCGGRQAALVDGAAGEFACFTTDARGEQILGYEAEKGQWLLFVPSDQSLDSTKLQYTGQVAAASKGKLDPDSGTIFCAFSESGDTVELTLGDGSTCTVTAMQSQLPSVQLRLNDTSLEEIHKDKTVKYEGNTFVLTTADGTQDLLAKNSVQVKGRGNTTWELYEKKGYQIKFATATSLLGMGAAKKWILLANAGDDSMIRTKLVYDMARQLDMAFVPSFEHVDLWIDGEYRGTYLLGEKVEIGHSRLDLTQYDGALFEHDEAYYIQDELWLYNVLLQRHFSLKEIMTEEPAVMETAMASFDRAVQELMAFLLTAPSEEVTLEALSAYIDVDSFAKYYLINEYVLNCESYATSFYWYMDGEEDVMHLGPIWDFDTCMGNDGMLPDQSYGDNHILFTYLLASQEFHARTEQLYEQYREAFASMQTDAVALKMQLRESAGMNYKRWNVLGTAGVKKDAQAFHVTFDEAVEAVQNWLAERADNFTVASCEPILEQTIYTGMCEDKQKLLIYMPEALAQKAVRLCVWNLDDPGSPMVWCNAQLRDRAWQAEVDLGVFSGAGTYSIHAYIDGGDAVSETGRCYIEKNGARICAPTAKLSEDGSRILLELEAKPDQTAASFAVWSDIDGQDDIQWIPAQRNDQGRWWAEAELAAFRDVGLFQIHAFAGAEGKQELQISATLEVP